MNHSGKASVVVRTRVLYSAYAAAGNSPLFSIPFRSLIQRNVFSHDKGHAAKGLKRRAFDSIT